jgi:hypothetical protein
MSEMTSTIIAEQEKLTGTGKAYPSKAYAAQSAGSAIPISTRYVMNGKP